MHLIMTRSGLAFDVMCPEAMAINLEDIAEGLALQYFSPGHTARPFSLAEYSMAVLDVLRRDFDVQDPAAWMVALLVEAHRAYMPLLDRDHVDLWGPKLTGIYTSLRKALCSRFAVHAATSGYARQISAACTRVQAVMLRDLAAHNTCLIHAARTEPCPEWLKLNLAEPHHTTIAEAYRLSFNECLNKRQAAIDAVPVAPTARPHASAVH